MPKPKILVIAKREYLSRVRTPAFWISTVALPLLMGAMMVLPSLIASRSKGALHLAVVDLTGKVAPRLTSELDRAAKEGGPQVKFDLELKPVAADVAAQRAALDRRVLADKLDAWLWITQQGIDSNKIEYHGRTTSNIITLQILESVLTRVVRGQRLAASGYDAKQVEKLVATIDLDRIRVTEEGGKADAGVGDFALAVGLFLILYMSIMIYGQMVMQGVLEEKTNRVVEVMASTAKPTELMAGKLVGICGAALTQILIWLVSVAILSMPGLLSSVFSLPAGVTLKALSLTLVCHFVALFLLGFTFYASFYALIGAAFNSAQEAQQLATVGVMFVVFPWMVFMPVINDPSSTMAVVSSLIPMFTPMIMMLRIAIKSPPAWQLALGYALTLGADLMMVWICGRVYRVGILMYGKRPTIKEIWRWTRYA